MSGRVVECTALEMRHTLTGIGGSNPPLSAIKPCELVSAHVSAPRRGRVCGASCAHWRPYRQGRPNAFGIVWACRGGLSPAQLRALPVSSETATG